MITDNLFGKVPRELPAEEITELLSTPTVRIERIVSMGHASPTDEWYDQDRAEWVLFLAGSAALIFQGEAEPILLEPGSYLHIPAHTRHMDRPIGGHHLAGYSLSMTAGRPAPSPEGLFR
jgi:cupin 2 domain-containing protein